MEDQIALLLRQIKNKKQAIKLKQKTNAEMKKKIQKELSQQATLQNEATLSTADRVFSNKMGGESVQNLIPNHEIQEMNTT